MKKSKLFLLLGNLLVIIAILFIAFALNHPEMSFPWPNTITYTLYGMYAITTITVFILFFISKK